MYQFHDVTLVTNEKDSLPTEAVSINGKYLENEIPGYQTLTVTGREIMEHEIKGETVDGLDGSLFLSSRVPARIITVKYKLSAISAGQFRQSFNKLNILLSEKQSQFVFADEPDKYFIGTVQGVEEPEPGRLDTTGEFEIFCSDPYKYALKESTASTTGNSIVIENNGLPCPVTYDITLNGDESGYLGIYSSAGCMEFGNRDERDFETSKRSETLINFNNLKSAISGNNKFIYSKYASGVGYGIRLANKGTDYADGEAEWTRAQFGVNVPADSSGSTTNTSYTIEARIRANTSQYRRWCSIGFDLMTSDNQSVARFRIMDWDNGLPYGSIHLDVGGWRREWLGEYWLSTNPPKGWKENPFGNESGKDWIRITKEGGNVTFQWWGSKPYTWYDPSNVSRNISKIVFFIDAPKKKDIHYVYENCGFEEFRFVKNNVPYTRDVPNRFSAQSRLKVDGENGKFYVNGNCKPGEEVIGSQYFKVPNGKTEVKFLTSGWSSASLSVTARWRERWL